MEIRDGELVQPICPRYSTLQTDRQTDGRLTITITRFALRASRGKNPVTMATRRYALTLGIINTADRGLCQPVRVSESRFS